MTRYHMKMNWELNSIRATAFLLPNQDLDISALWVHISGDEADSIVHKRDKSVSAAGQIGSGQGQLDLSLDGRLSLEIEGVGPDNLSTWPSAPHETLDLFISGIKDERIYRLATGLILMDRVNDLKEGYSALGTLLEGTVTVEHDSMRDFSFQVNRPRMVGEGEVNRLCSWSVAEVYQGTIGRSMQLERSFWTRLAIDVSTKPASPVPEAMTDILGQFSALRGIANEIADKGTNA